MDGTSLNHTLADVVVAIDGNKIFNGCGLGLDECSEVRPCPLHFEFKRIRKDLYALLSTTKLGELQDSLEFSTYYLSRR